MNSTELQQSEREKLLDARNSALIVELDTTKCSLDACHEKLATLQSQNSKLIDEAEILKSVKSDLDNQYETLAAERDQLNNEIEKIKSDFTAQTARFADDHLDQENKHQTELAGQILKYQTVMAQLDAANVELEKVRETVLTRENEIKSATEANSEATSTLKSTQAQRCEIQNNRRFLPILTF